MNDQKIPYQHLTLVMLSLLSTSTLPIVIVIGAWKLQDVTNTIADLRRALEWLGLKRVVFYLGILWYPI